ncbi:MAG: GvpL/GvpF family gas vesicle protein, partial [Nitrospirota bacterium]
GFAADKKVHTIPYQDISAVVSDSSFLDYTTLPKDQVARYLLTHQQVIEKLMDSYTIIPMRLGTYAFNKGEVKEILCKGHKKFKDIFKKIENKTEIDVVATWNDLNSTIKEVGEVQEIRELKEKLMSRPGGVSVEDQIKIGSLLKNVLNKKRKKISFEIKEALGRVSIDLRMHDLMDDRMIFNAAFLIDKVRQNEFEKELDALNESYGGRINFRCVCPLPPYSFYTAEVKKLPFNDIAWAKEKLEINDMATKEEIIKAYRSKANIYHPDKNINSSDADGQFNEIFRAYKILCEYCDGNVCLPDKKEFSQDAIIIKVRE